MMERGTQVRITAGQLGLTPDPDQARFVDTITHGEYAHYYGPHPNQHMADQGWDLLTITRDDVTLWCPVHDSHYEAGDLPRRY
jgi:hypothetical protein